MRSNSKAVWFYVIIASKDSFEALEKWLAVFRHLKSCKYVVIKTLIYCKNLKLKAMNGQKQRHTSNQERTAAAGSGFLTGIVNFTCELSR